MSAILDGRSFVSGMSLWKFIVYRMSGRDDCFRDVRKEFCVSGMPGKILLCPGCPAEVLCVRDVRFESFVYGMPG